MKKLLGAFMAAAVALGVCAGRADAMTITVVTGTTQNATSVTDLLTSMGMVGSLQVTATFLDGSSQTLTWGPISDPYCLNCAGVTSTSGGWSLIGAGNTFAMQWMFNQTSTLGLASLSLSGTGIAFDRSWATEGTAGSAGGMDFRPDTNNDGFTDDPAGWLVTYSNAIGLNGADPVGDLYANLTIDFGTGGYTGNFRFLQDTDVFVAGSTGGGGEPAPVPEPASLFLLGTGLFGAAAVSRKRGR